MQEQTSGYQSSSIKYLPIANIWICSDVWKKNIETNSKTFEKYFAINIKTNSFQPELVTSNVCLETMVSTKQLYGLLKIGLATVCGKTQEKVEKNLKKNAIKKAADLNKLPGFA